MHKSVLLDEIMEILRPELGKVFIDATADGGGHLGEILKRLPEKGRLIGIDRDEEMIKKLEKRYGKDKRVELVCGNFRNIKELASGYQGEVDGILFDLGYSSIQLEESGRGFSFQKEEPLLMTYQSDPGPNDLTAAKIVNGHDAYDLELLLRDYGEERYARALARAIVRARKKERITGSKQLANIISEAVPKGYEKGRIHPATRAFQALRIAVNDELGVIKDGLEGGWDLLGPSGKMAVISFHSLEDREVKRFFKQKEFSGGKILTKKPITPTAEEISQNPRARSAKLRVAEKLK